MSGSVQTRTSAAPRSTLTPAPHGLLQRKCDCGGSAGLDGECEACRNKRLQRCSANGVEPTTLPPIVHEVLSSPDRLRDAAMHTSVPLRFGHDFNKISIYTATSQIVQPKLKINQPGDVYEQEADHVAETVMRMPDSRVSVVDTFPSSVLLHRKCACGGNAGLEGECEECHSKKLQRRTANGIEPMTVPPIVHEVLRSPGQPLDSQTRAFFEPRFGYDFSQVRVHTDSKAAESARDVNAHAYTVKHKMVFGTGQFAPRTNAGRRLLAHELTHVMQQSSSDGIRVGPSNEKLGLFPITSAPDRSIQRDEAPKTPEKSVGNVSMETTKKDAQSALKEIESNWKEIRGPAAAFGDVAAWLSKGDTVIGLLQTHTKLAFDAMDRGDSALIRFMKLILESDLVMYRFIAWHVVVFVNLIAMEPKLKEYADSFAADTRKFTGQAEAEERVRLLRQLAAIYRADAPNLIAQAKVIPASVIGTSGQKIQLTVTIAASDDKSIKDFFAKKTADFIQNQIAIQTLVEENNRFFDNAFKEGLGQTGEALIEFFTVKRGQRGGGDPKVTKRTVQGRQQQQRQPQQQQQPQAQPKPQPQAQPKPQPQAQPKPQPQAQPKPQQKSPPQQQQKAQGGKYTCFGRSFVLQIPNALPEHKCPDEFTKNRYDGPPVSAPSEDAACLAAKHAFNAMMPRGCRPKHLKCVCTKR